MKHHWMEEAQHAKLDTLIVDALAEGRTEEQIEKAIDEFFEIGGFLDAGLKQQAAFNLDALEKVIGRTVEDREAIIAQQHQAARCRADRRGRAGLRLKQHSTRRI